MPHSSHDDTIPVEVQRALDADTEETPVVTREQKERSQSAVEIATDLLVLAEQVDRTPQSGEAQTPTPIGTPPPKSTSSPVIGLAKPKGGGESTMAKFAERKYRLPTQSEIRAAIEGTPTEPVPLVDRSSQGDETADQDDPS